MIIKIILFFDRKVEIIKIILNKKKIEKIKFKQVDFLLIEDKIISSLVYLSFFFGYNLQNIFFYKDLLQNIKDK